jgi:hypothetical protein
MGYHVICMENYVAKDERTDERCKQDAASCDFYVGVFAWRYGYVPPEDNPNAKSITELEYQAAQGSEKVTVLTFLLADDVAWHRNMMDVVTGENESGKRIDALRLKLLKRSPAFFCSPPDLAVQIVTSIYQAEATLRVSKVGLFDSNQSTRLNTSDLPDIDGMVREAGKACVVELDLGDGNSWWTTRLHLTASLATDFTDLRQIVLVDSHNCLLAMYSPDQIRRALASAFPILEIAYLRSRRGIDIRDASAPSKIVHCVGKQLRNLTDGKNEEVIKEWVSKQSLDRWMTGIPPADCLKLTGQPSHFLQHQIISCNSRFVALIENERLIKVVDRVKIVTELAKHFIEERWRG